MNRLFIITDTVEHGDQFGFKWGLSSPKYKAITCMEDLDKIPEKVIFINDDFHCPDSVAINDALRNRGGIELKDMEFAKKFIGSIYAEVQTMNQMYDMYRDERSTDTGSQKLTGILQSMGLTSNRGFDFIVYRDPNRFYWSIIPRSEFMEVIISLYSGYVKELISLRDKPYKVEVGHSLLHL